MEKTKEKREEVFGSIIMAVGILAALWLRYLCINFESGDYTYCLKVWVEYFAENGGWRALKNGVGGYNVVYQYFIIICSYLKISPLYPIKFVSIAFDFVWAWGVSSFLKCFDISKLKRLFVNSCGEEISAKFQTGE